MVGGWTNPFEKYAQVKLDHFARDRGENRKVFELPPPKFQMVHLKIPPKLKKAKIHLKHTLKWLWGSSRSVISQGLLFHMCPCFRFQHLNPGRPSPPPSPRWWILSALAGWEHGRQCRPPSRHHPSPTRGTFHWFQSGFYRCEENTLDDFITDFIGFFFRKLPVQVVNSHHQFHQISYDIINILESLGDEEEKRPRKKPKKKLQQQKKTVRNHPRIETKNLLQLPSDLVVKRSPQSWCTKWYLLLYL